MFLLIYKTYCDDYDTNISVCKNREKAEEKMNEAIKDAFGEDIDWDNETDDAGTLLKDCSKVGRFFMTEYEYLIEERC